jgi:hypothetical protein
MTMTLLATPTHRGCRPLLSRPSAFIFDLYVNFSEG